MTKLETAVVAMLWAVEGVRDEPGNENLVAAAHMLAQALPTSIRIAFERALNENLEGGG